MGAVTITFSFKKVGTAKVQGDRKALPLKEQRLVEYFVGARAVQ